MEDGDRKCIICAVGFLYEWGFVKCIGDETKQGFVLRKMKDGTLFDSCDEMITELESKIENVTGENLDLFTEIISSYKNNGINKTFSNDIMHSIMKNSATKQMLLENPITALLFSENKDMKKFPNV